ncbi:hypothetical protein U9M48_034924 [Paspalum notatum var. saurae]|uniref:BZIP domain-containing protein n=1 Tax=Paspalum notatum var. saurae TaxID=547442 RepID=A0AAQ3UA52_PASNO
MSDDQRQCRRGGISTADVEQELGAALALADMAGVVEAPRAPAAGAGAEPERHQMTATDEEEDEEEEEMASTRLSLQLGRVGIQSPSSVQQQPPPAHHGPSSRPRHALTEAEKEAKRLRRVLANRESARQTIIRRQEKDLVMKEYLSLKETNEQLKVKAQAHHHHLSLSLF